MDNQFEDMDLELKDLRAEVREKALELLAGMSAEQRADRDLSVRIAIQQAENWFMDSEG